MPMRLKRDRYLSSSPPPFPLLSPIFLSLLLLLTLLYQGPMGTGYGERHAEKDLGWKNSSTTTWEEMRSIA